MPDRQTPDPTKSPFGYYALRMRRERTKAGLKQEEVARHVTVSPQLYGHYENCRRVPTMDVSEGLDDLYNLDEFFAGLHPLVISELELSPQYVQYVKEEDRASHIRMYDPLYVPGLFQHEDYAREILRGFSPPDDLEHDVASRMSRQKILDRDEPPRIFVLLSETAIRNPVGSPEIMKAQLARLLEFNEKPNVSVQIVPWGAPVHVPSPFTLLDFPEGGSLGYVDATGGNGTMIQIPERLQRLAVRWEEIKGEALSFGPSEARIRQELESL
ncbi:transcriptional regulator [Actinomadura barringtoniae]|uniref:Transcriptional regulator n=1 Tax=Actinomadura barringtoniae TaxID=1427535 RepID=A0A939P6Q6_9ACTN|nr:helix-turn-helix transcriptional regulator [Actinomadura barringtoniae]MBO2446465.1 transcriptional regulator [Actinomadura barringtoniae]